MSPEPTDALVAVSELPAWTCESWESKLVV